MPLTLYPITVRTEDKILKLKLQRIARKNGRALSREVEQVLIRYVESYEKEHGEIKIKK